VAILDLDKGIDRIGDAYDVGIIGAGPAGIALGLELAERGLQVLICEGGGREWTERSQNVYRGEASPNYYELDLARLRFLGGSTNHWGGNIHLLDESDFEPNPAAAAPGWPIAYSDIEPYFAGAWTRLGFPPSPTPVEQIAESAGFPAELVQSGPVRSTLFRFAGPANYHVRHRDLIRDSAGLQLILNANIVDIVPTSTGIDSLVVRNWAGDTKEVKVDRAVFASGGIENARLMLNFAERHDVFDTVADVVGSYFMEHLCIYSGAVLATDADTAASLAPITSPIGTGADAYQWVGYIEPSARAGNGVDTNVSFTLDKPYTVPVTDVTAARPGLGVNEILRLSGGRSDSGLFITPRAEQLPNPESRVSLLDSVDSLGLKRARLDWRYTPADYASIVRAIGLFARNVTAAGIGRVFMPEDHTDWSSRFGRPIGGFHHMGTTRMSDSPAWGVVDGNLRVHGTDNVYVAGSSVFSTGGWANPTVNIIAFSLRLADHLATT